MDDAAGFASFVRARERIQPTCMLGFNAQPSIAGVMAEGRAGFGVYHQLFKGCQSPPALQIPMVEEAVALS